MSIASVVTRGYVTGNNALVVTRGYGAVIGAGGTGTVAKSIDIVRTNRFIAAQEVSKDIGFIERNKEVEVS